LLGGRSLPEEENMKIAVLSDIHANSFALKEVISDLRQIRVDKTVFLGDLIMTGPNPLESLQLLQELDPFIWIQGNTDNWLAGLKKDFIPKNEMEVFLKKLHDFAISYIDENFQNELVKKPIVDHFTYDNNKIIFCHGSPKTFSQGLLTTTKKQIVIDAFDSTKADVIVCGHTHIPTILQVQGKVLINFGSISIPGNDFCKEARYGIIDFHDGIISYSFRNVKYDLEAFFNEMRIRNFPGINQVKEKFGF